MKKDKESKQDNDISMNLALGLSIGTLLGVAIDNIGVGMLMGVAVGLCFYPAIGTLKKNSKSFEHKNSFYGFIWIIFGIASGMMSKNTGGSEVQDFLSGLLMVLSVVEILVGIWMIGKQFFHKS